MQIEKGVNYITMADINNLMDLYTQAVEFYNSSYQNDRQKYYESKLQKLLDQPNVKKLYSKNEEAKEDNPVDDSNQQAQKKTMQQAILESEKQKARNVMSANIHQRSKQQE